MSLGALMEAVSTSETLVNFYQTTRGNIPEDSHLHIPRRENLKSHLVTSVIIMGNTSGLERDHLNVVFFSNLISNIECLVLGSGLLLTWNFCKDL
jgi:hypothetical protein